MISNIDKLLFKIKQYQNIPLWIQTWIKYLFKL